MFGAIYFYFEGIPVVSDFLAKQVPEKVELELGKTVRDELLSKYKLDDERTETINEFFTELNFGDKPKIYVVKSKQLNAFALPGNYIFVFDEVLRKAESYPELAGLLGHEYTHLTKNHGMRGLARALGYELFTLIVFGSDKDVSSELARNANLLINMEYSREFEIEADLNALRMMRANKIDASGLTDLFKKLEKDEKQSSKNVPSYMRSHPVTRDRIEYLQDSIAATPYKSVTNLKLDSLFNKLTTFESKSRWDY